MLGKFILSTHSVRRSVTNMIENWMMLMLLCVHGHADAGHGRCGRGLGFRVAGLGF